MVTVVTMLLMMRVMWMVVTLLIAATLSSAVPPDGPPQHPPLLLYLRPQLLLPPPLDLAPEQPVARRRYDAAAGLPRLLELLDIVGHGGVVAGGGTPGQHPALLLVREDAVGPALGLDQQPPRAVHVVRAARCSSC